MGVVGGCQGRRPGAGAHSADHDADHGSVDHDIAETDPADVLETYTTVIAALARLDLAYLHLIESPDRDLTTRPTAFILNPFTHPEPTGPSALAHIEDGTADIIAFGALFLANPDLPARLAAGGPYNTPDPATFYGGDHRGYTDYPALPADSA